MQPIEGVHLWLKGSVLVQYVPTQSNYHEVHGIIFVMPAICPWGYQITIFHVYVICFYVLHLINIYWRFGWLPHTTLVIIRATYLSNWDKYLLVFTQYLIWSTWNMWTMYVEQRLLGSKEYYNFILFVIATTNSLA